MEREYHSDDDSGYFLPNDLEENGRLDVQHRLFQCLLEGKIFAHEFAQGEEPNVVVDLGTGSGIWANEVAAMYPSARVYGLDISDGIRFLSAQWSNPAVQLKNRTWNVEFKKFNIESSLPFDDESVDFVHSRFLFTSIRNWHSYLSEIFRVLRPGGAVEICEPQSGVIVCRDGSGKHNDSVKALMDLFRARVEQNGADWDIVPKAQRLMQEYMQPFLGNADSGRVGFTSVRDVSANANINHWNNPSANKWQHKAEELAEEDAKLVTKAVADGCIEAGLDKTHILQCLADATADYADGECHYLMEA